MNRGQVDQDDNTLRRLRPAIGVVATVVAILLVEWVRTGLGIGLPGVLLLPVVLLATLAAGRWTGAASALMVLGYGGHHYGGEADWLNLALLTLATAATFGIAVAWPRFTRTGSARRAVADDVHATARRYRELVDDLDLILWESRPGDRGFSFISPGIVDLLGYPAEMWLDQRSDILEKVVHSEDRQRLEEVCERARRTGEDYETEFRLVARDGRVVWVHNLARLIAVPEGGYVEHGVIVDITDRRQAEEALRLSEQRYRIAQNLSLEGFAIFEPIRDGDGRIVDLRWERANAAAARLWDLHPAQLRGRRWGETVAETGENQALFAQYVRVAESGESADAELPFHSRQVQGWLRSIAVKVDDRVAVSLSDISQRRLAEQALRESEERFRTLADSAPIPIWLTGPDRAFTYVNRAWLQLTGRAMEQDLGHGWIDNIHPDDYRCTMPTLRRSIAAQQPFRVEHRLRRYDGAYRWVISQGAPRFLPDGTFAGYVGSCVDITDRKQAEQQLQRRLDRQETVVRLGQAALANTPLDELAHSAVDQVARTLEVDLCEILCYEPAREELSLSAAVGWDPQLADKARLPADPSSQFGYALRSETPVVVADLERETRFDAARPLLDAEANSGVSVAIPGEQGTPYGILSAHSRERRTFTGADTNFVQAVAHVLATAIHRTHAEQALRFSETRFRSMFDHAAVGVAYAELSGRFTAVNQRLCEMLGYSAEELKQRTYRDITFPDDLPEDDAYARQLVHGEIDHYNMEKRFVRKDGSVIWTELTCSAVHEPGGGLFAVGIIADITRRKQAEHELKLLNETLEQRVAERTAEARERADQLGQSERKLREQTQVLQSILDSIGEGIVVADPHGRFLVWNPPARQMLGEPAEMSPERWPEHYHLYRPDGTRFATKDMPLMRAMHGEAIDDADALIRRPGEAIRWLSVAARPLCDPEGNIRGGVTIFRDITGRRAAEQKLREYQLQLRSLTSELTLTEQRERRRLAQVLHDHLQQILVAAQLRIGVVRSRTRASDVQHALAQLADLVSEAIEASRSLTLELSPPILYDAGLTAAARWLGRQMRAKHHLNVDVETNFEDDELPEDVRILIFQAVRELLFNVVKHAEARSACVMLRMMPDDELRVEVSDRGRGFDPSRTRESGRGETGFGLFSIRERLELIGGSMHLDSQPGQGTRVTLTTPPSANRAVTPPPSAQPAGRGRRTAAAGPHADRTIRVLLADDHKVLRDGLASLLSEEPDIEIVGEASDGQMAVDLTRRIHPDVVVMDVTMPQLNGIEATRQVLQQMPGVRVIGLSMHDDRTLAEGMYRAGAVDYLPKGGPADGLVAAIRQAVHR